MESASGSLSPDLIIQYSIVGVVLLAVFAWMVWKIVKMSKKNSPSGGCCGCGLADTCKKKNLKSPSR